MTNYDTRDSTKEAWISENDNKNSIDNIVDIKKEIVNDNLLNDNKENKNYDSNDLFNKKNAREIEAHIIREKSNNNITLPKFQTQGTKDTKVSSKKSILMKNIELSNINHDSNINYDKIPTPKKPKWLIRPKRNFALLTNKGLVSVIIPFDAETQKYVISNIEDIETFENKNYILESLDIFNHSSAISLNTFELNKWITALYIFAGFIFEVILIYISILAVLLTILNLMICFCCIVINVKFIQRLIIIYENIKKNAKSRVVERMIEKENMYSQRLYDLTWEYGRDGLYLEINYKRSEQTSAKDLPPIKI